MVANPPVDRGAGSNDYLVNQLRSLEKRVAALSSKSPLPIADGAGVEMVSLDKANGWGLRNPTLDVAMYPDTPDAPTVSTATWVTQWHGYFTVLHPRLWISAMLVTRGAGTVAGGLRWQVDSPTMTASLTPATTLAGVGSIQDAQAIDFAAADEGGLAVLRLQVQMSGTVIGGNVALTYPLWAWRVRSGYPN